MKKQTEILAAWKEYRDKKDDLYRSQKKKRMLLRNSMFIFIFMIYL